MTRVPNRMHPPPTMMRASRPIRDIPLVGESVLVVSPMQDTVECPLCGGPVVFTVSGAEHQQETRCTAEGLARSADDLGRLADAFFGAPLGAAYRDLNEAKRLDGHSAGVLKSITLLRNGHPSPWFRTGEDMTVQLRYEGAKRNAYFAVYLMNEFAERMATVHSTHDREHEFPEDGTVQCVIERLAVGEGSYYIMVDYGIAPPMSFGSRPQPISLDCVPNAGKVRVKLDGYLGGVGLTPYEGAAIRSSWRLL